MDLIYKEITNDYDISALSNLANKIWNIHYPSIIGERQVEYMLEKMYSLESLRNQIIKEDHKFIGAYLHEEMVAFISYYEMGEDNYFIHKLYVNAGIHGKGIGRALYEHVFRDKIVKSIRLTVNRHNVNAINFYFKMGFNIEKTIDIDIGEGFVMNDFLMIYKNNFR